MRVLVLIQGSQVAASRYRILQYIPYLEAQGLHCYVREFPLTMKHYIRLYAMLEDYDCVFVQRKRFHFPFLKLFRGRTKRVVYDLDDAVMYRNSLAGSPYSRTRQKRFEKMVKASDCVIAGNSFLMERTLPYQEQVYIIPTSIPLSQYRLKDYALKKESVTIGWIGDHGSIHYLEGLRHIFDEMGKRYPGRVELKIICDVFFDCDHIPVRKTMWSSENEVKELQDCDIGVMPLKDDAWSWGKCGLKILQYYGVGIPAVCTPVGVNRDVVRHGVTGYWAMNDVEWIQALSSLIEDEALRRDMGLAGRKVFEEGYTLETNAPKLLGILKGSAEQRG